MTVTETITLVEIYVVIPGYLQQEIFVHPVVKKDSQQALKHQHWFELIQGIQLEFHLISFQIVLQKVALFLAYWLITTGQTNFLSKINTDKIV